MNTEKSIAKLTFCINEIEDLKNESGKGSSKYQVWMEQTEALVRNIFNETSVEYKEIHSLFHPRWIPPVSYGTDYPRERVDYYQQYLYLLDRVKNKLSSYISVLDIKSDSERTCDNSDPLNVVLHICSRFSNVVRSLKKRYSNRTPLTMKDEYDVQYLLNSLLTVSFDDVRSEEPVPSCASTSSRIDFLLKNEGIAIETKMTRANLDDKELSKQLIQDIAQYQAHPDVTTLVCFVYDPNQLIVNPVSIINDLEQQSRDNLTVKVVITPM